MEVVVEEDIYKMGIEIIFTEKNNYSKQFYYHLQSHDCIQKINTCEYKFGKSINSTIIVLPVKSDTTNNADTFI